MVPRRLRWVAVAVPAVVVGLIELLSDTVFDPVLPSPWDTILVTAVVLVLAALFARFAFGRIDRLTSSLEARNREVEARAASASALHTVSLSIASLADLESVLQATVDSARRLLGADVAALVLVGPDGEPTLRSTSGNEAAFDRSGMSATGAAGDVERFLVADRAAAVLATPLRRGGDTIGTLAVAGRRAPHHGVDDVETLSSLATQAAIAIEHDRLQAEARTLAIHHERARIAGEIHDGLAQVLGYVNTKSGAVEALLDAGRIAEARVQMAELNAAARSVYIDVRDAIAGLTEPIAADIDLEAQLREDARRSAERSKLAISVHVDPDLDTTALSPSTRDAIVGVVRESLSNARKHAAARRVTVDLATRDALLVVTVADDGRGFDPDRPDEGPADWPHLGMTTIRERAAAIDGHVTWRSAPGGGTTVVLVIPLEAAAPAADGPATGAGA